MKHITKNGHEITFGNPEHSPGDHLRNGANRVRTIAHGVGGVAAAVALSRRGKGASGKLGAHTGKLHAIATGIDALATVHDAYYEIRGKRSPLAEQPSAADGDTNPLGTGEMGELDTLRANLASQKQQD